MKKQYFYGAIVFALAVCSSVVAGNINNRIRPDGIPVIVPEVQRYEKRNGVLPLPETLTVSAPAAADNEADLFLRLVKKYLPGRKAMRVDRNPFCRLELADSGLPDNPEAYTVEISSCGVVIRAREPQGLFYGVHTLGNIFRNAEKPELANCLITDWPDVKLRIVYFERVITRDRSNLQRLLKEIDLIGSLKYNAIELELAEFFPYKNNPFTRRKGKFLPEDVEALKAAAKRNHLEIIPYLKVISHDQWMHAHPRYWEDIAEGIPHESAWATASCPLRPLPREIYRMAIREHIECFKPRFFFIGLDEVSQCPWGVCKLCRKYTRHELLRKVTLEYTQEVLKYGVAPVIDHDQFFPGLPIEGEKILPEVDRRVIVCNWDYAEKINPARFDFFKKAGFPMWGASSAIRCNNLKALPMMMRKKGVDALVVTFWGTWRKLDDPRRVTPAGLAGFINGVNYAWKIDAVAPSGQTFDPARETLRIYAPELVVDTASYKFKVLPLDADFNAKLGREAGFPLLDAQVAGVLKRELAETHEKFHLATSTDGGYFAVKAGAGKGEHKSVEVKLGNIKAEALSLLMVAGSLGDTPKKYDRSKLGSLVFNYADGGKEEIPLYLTVNINHWNATDSGFNIRFVNRFNDLRGALAAFFAFDWKNPYPDRSIASVTVNAEGTYEVPLAIFAVSAGNCSAGASAAADDVSVARRLNMWSRGYFEAIKTGDADLNDSKVIMAFDKGIPRKAKIGLTVKAKGRLIKSVENDPSAPVPGPVLRLDVPANAAGVKQRQRIVIDIPVDLSKCKNEVKTLIFDYKMASTKVVSNPGCYIAEAGGRSLTRIPFWENQRQNEDGKWYTAKIAIDRMRREGGGDFPVSTANRVRLSVFFFPLQEPTTVWFGPVRFSAEHQNSAPMLRLEKVYRDGSEKMVPARATHI